MQRTTPGESNLGKCLMKYPVFIYNSEKSLQHYTNSNGHSICHEPATMAGTHMRQFTYLWTRR